MDKKNPNEELQSRREFFKKAAKAALPVVGAVVLSSLPIVKSEAATLDCNGSCMNSCFWSCQGSCETSCDRTCDCTCQGNCKTGCYKECYGTCSAGCAKQAYA